MLGQHVPETTATQSCPAGCQACVSCVVSSPVLHHVHSIFGSFPIPPRRGPPLPANLWLSRVRLIWRLSWARIRTSRAHWSRGVVRITWIRLLHVHLWRVTLSWIAWATGAIVWRGLLKIHLWLEQSPKEQENRCDGVNNGTCLIIISLLQSSMLVQNAK